MAGTQYFIFGGSGFIGQHLIQHLLKQKDCEIFCLDIKAPDELPSKITYIETDVRNKIELSGILINENAKIINLAAVHKTPGHPSRDYFDTNIRGAENITEFATRNNLKSIVFTSSIAPYGASETLKSETTIPQPNTPYGISKLVAEYIHKCWQKTGNHNLHIVRPGVVFGHSENGNFTRLYKAMASRRFAYPGRRDTVKACIYVKDVVSIIGLMTQQESIAVCETYNLTYEKRYTIEEICQSIARVTGAKVPTLVIPSILLLLASIGINAFLSLFGLNGHGIHPDRVRKLMISTNIEGKHLGKSKYKLQYSLDEAIQDWHYDCNRMGLF
ncbi:MAG: NAD(P)-dependent oxidoreductase [Cyclobacteriaceae bacterium]